MENFVVEICDDVVILLKDIVDKIVNNLESSTNSQDSLIKVNLIHFIFYTIIES